MHIYASTSTSYSTRPIKGLRRLTALTGLCSAINPALPSHAEPCRAPLQPAQEWPAGCLACRVFGCNLQPARLAYKNEGESERCLVTVSLVLCLLAVSSVRLANMSSLVQHIAESAGVSNVV